VAVSFIIHFRRAEESAVAGTLDRVAKREQDQWLYGAPSLIVMPYRDLHLEYEQHERAKVESALGSPPTASLIVRLRPHHDARSDAEELVLKLLASHSGMVDDTYSDLWTSDEIANETSKRHGRFLDCYFTE
jgi:hypothetical protein